MSIYTRKGDSGKTTNFSGECVDKDCQSIEALGTIDELNSLLGVIASDLADSELKKKIEEVQKELFTIGLEIIGGGKRYKQIGSSEVSKLESWINEYEEKMPVLNHFIIPGGDHTAARFHVARTVCRRAERRVVEMGKKEKINGNNIIYLNRLSDFLFIAARWINFKKRIKETEWSGKKIL